MKIYTEEQLRQAFIDGMKFIAVHPLKYEQDANEYMSSLTPIELPSDEEIGKDIGSGMHDFYKGGFIEGAKWIKEQIFKQ